MSRRFAILALIATLLPTFLVPGRVALCLGDCGCGLVAAEEPGALCAVNEIGEAADTAPRSCCSCCCSATELPAQVAEQTSSCDCGTVTSPRREDRPSCPNCAVFERGFAESTSPESFDWECPALRDLPQLSATLALTLPSRLQITATPRDPREPPPRPRTPLRV